MTPRLAAYGLITAALAVAAVSLWAVVAGWRADSLALPGVQMRLAAEIASRETERTLRREYDQARENDHAELEKVRAAGAARPRVVCSRASDVPALGGGAGGSAPSGAGAWVVPQGAGRNLEPALTRLVDRADDLNLQLRQCQVIARQVVAAAVK